MTLPSLPQDKANHILLGLVAYLPVAYLLTPIAGLVAAVIVGAAKELYDATGRGTPDVYDMLATVGGGIVGLACSVVGAP